MKYLVCLSLLLASCSATPSMDCTRQYRHNDGDATHPRTCWTHMACLDGRETDTKPLPCP